PPPCGPLASSPDPTQWIKQKLAETQARIGDLDAALKTVSEIGSDGFGKFTRKSTVEQIIAARLEAGDVTGARRTADLIPDSDLMFQDDKTNLLEQIARYQAEHGDAAATLEWATKQSSPKGKLQLVRALADGIAARSASKKPEEKKSSDSGAQAKQGH